MSLTILRSSCPLMGAARVFPAKITRAIRDPSSWSCRVSTRAMHFTHLGAAILSHEPLNKQLRLQIRRRGLITN